MTLLEQINSDIKAAMKAKDKEKLQALRAVKTAFTLEMTKTGSTEIADADALKIIQKLAKQRKDSADTYIAGGRQELADVELKEMSFIEAYLPAQISDEELTAAIKVLIEKTGASSIKDMGKVVGMASKELAGRAEGKTIADKVKALLA
ncbi:GatB/YqeY domain-containing protein [Ancylomarina euxinus]|uniref:GatB/YqeY domain-containing protein n=1 Tax=Ancylomarina euxinus TaxID=2283627 RepID=A0A425Y0X4_9BACT|nr:GatB/YqeY domain-containing protein [Ancylomarina euxinus]MCZ4693819.1 GatB/YqeY domain-containing protein [Ancylomarina euxinus]MUP15102.1 GatB/YqeY domain-containing protein [Ancylomarina euxinus]RRG21524.1 GatB/YqeY domain-containing protein [Ancylomarina euxinus]